MRLINLGVALGGVLLSSATFATEPVADDKARLQGEWAVKEITTTTGGERSAGKKRFNFQGDKVIGTIDVGAVAELEGGYELAGPILTMHAERPLAGGPIIVKYRYSFEAQNLVLCRFDDSTAATAAPSSCVAPNVRRLDLERPKE